MSSADARAWCEARFAAAPAEAAAPEPLPEAASAPADPAPTQAPAEAAEALARLRELQATALPTRRIRDELTAPPAVGDLVEAEQVPPGSVVERETGSIAARLPDGRGLHGWPLPGGGGFDWPGMLLEGARCRLLAVGLTAEECQAATSREAVVARCAARKRAADGT